MILFSILVGVALALMVWWWHERYENSIIRKAERKARERVCFPSPEERA